MIDKDEDWFYYERQVNEGLVTPYSNYQNINHELNEEQDKLEINNIQSQLSSEQLVQAIQSIKSRNSNLEANIARQSSSFTTNNSILKAKKSLEKYEVDQSIQQQYNEENKSKQDTYNEIEDSVDYTIQNNNSQQNPTQETPNRNNKDKTQSINEENFNEERTNSKQYDKLQEQISHVRNVQQRKKSIFENIEPKRYKRKENKILKTNTFQKMMSKHDSEIRIDSVAQGLKITNSTNLKTQIRTNTFMSIKNSQMDQLQQEIKNMLSVMQQSLSNPPKKSIQKGTTTSGFEQENSEEAKMRNLIRNGLDLIHNFTFYFPHNNFEKIKEEIYQRMLKQHHVNRETKKYNSKRSCKEKSTVKNIKNDRQERNSSISRHNVSEQESKILNIDQLEIIPNSQNNNLETSNQNDSVMMLNNNRFSQGEIEKSLSDFNIPSAECINQKIPITLKYEGKDVLNSIQVQQKQQKW